jgi:hypothetical protein
LIHGICGDADDRQRQVPVHIKRIATGVRIERGCVGVQVFAQADPASLVKRTKIHRNRRVFTGASAQIFSHTAKEILIRVLVLTFPPVDSRQA